MLHTISTLEKQRDPMARAVANLQHHNCRLSCMKAAAWHCMFEKFGLRRVWQADLQLMYRKKNCQDFCCIRAIKTIYFAWLKIFNISITHADQPMRVMAVSGNQFSMHQTKLPVRYAKLAQPRLFDARPRERLFARLDALRRTHPVVWIASPPGAGKTTLAASYLTQSEASSIWYQVDEDDADPGTFFYYLTETLRGASSALPRLAPELSGDIPRFARLFFREYYARLPHGTVVVLDNIQELDWDVSGELIEIAFSEIPDGVTVLALSREAPPARLARLELSGRLMTIGWNEMRLEREEALALAQLDASADPLNLAWLDRIDGWAAGVIMLREHIDQYPLASQTSDIPLLDGQEAVFRYFAGEILERMPETSQRLLMLLSCLPSISPDDAQQLTGDPAASRLLSQLFNNRLFVDRRGPPFTYHFHALFREFLQYQAQQRLDADERTSLRERAAEILSAQGRIDEAVRLCHEAGAHSRLVDLLLSCARDMLAAGRGQAWREWMHWIPPELIGHEPRLLYWEGASLNHVDPVKGRQVLARAEQAFRETGDVLYRVLAIAAIIESYFYEWADFQPLPAWVAEMMNALRLLDLESLDPEMDLQIHSRLTLALFVTTPESPLLAASAQRALAALPLVDDAAERLAAGALLMIYLNWGDTAAARELAIVLSPLVDHPEIAPFHRISWCRSAVYRYQFDGNLEAAQQMMAVAQNLATVFGLERMQFQLHFRTGLNLLATGDLSGALELLTHMRRIMSSPTRKLELLYVRILETSYFAQTGATTKARQAAEEAIRLDADARLRTSTRWQIDTLLAYCCAQAGDYEAARHWSDRVIEDVFGPEKEAAAEEMRFLSAYLDYVNGNTVAAVTMLEELLRKQREQQASFPMLLRLVPHIANTLLPLALRENIEVEHVRGIIAKRSFAPPDRLTPHWPWPIAVRSLGKVEISFHGEIVKSAGRAQQRPLMLLKALAAAGDAGRALPTLADQLWPEANDAKASLNVTIHRLRKLLGNEQAIIVTDGKITLDGTKVWSDVSALADACERIGALENNTTVSEIKRMATVLLDLYRGPFCDGDEDSLLLTARETYRNRFLGAVRHLGEALESACEWSTAQNLYARALEAEPLAEMSYRGVMRCANAQNDPSAAFSAYRRCREILSIVLGRYPSPETEALALSLGLKEHYKD